MSKFTIAHLSDLHLVADDRDPRHEPPFHKRLRGMNENCRRLLRSPALRACDRIVVTGDVTDRGDPAAWQKFWHMVDEAGLSDRTLVVPGNHDVCRLGLVSRSPTAARIEQARRGLELGGQNTSFPWVELADEGRVAFFAVDASNVNNATALTNALGKLPNAQLVKLGQLLLQHQSANYKFILLHHSPNVPQPATSKRRQEQPVPRYERPFLQMDRSARRGLRLLARLFGVKAILHGHTHDNLDRRVDGVRLIGCPASTEPEDGHLRYKHLTLYRESGILRARIRKVTTRGDAP